MAYMEYTTLDDFKLFFPSTTLTDAQINALIARWSRLLDVELGDNIGEQTITKRMDGYGKAKLVMENKINSVSLVRYAIRKTWREVDVDYIDGVMVYLDEELPKGDNNVEITYTKWYTDLPADIQDFFHLYCQRLLNYESNIAGGGNGEVKTKKINGLSITYKTPSEIADSASKSGGGFSTAFAQILNKYKNFSLKVA